MLKRRIETKKKKNNNIAINRVLRGSHGDKPEKVSMKLSGTITPKPNFYFSGKFSQFYNTSSKSTKSSNATPNCRSRKASK